MSSNDTKSVRRGEKKQCIFYSLYFEIYLYRPAFSAFLLKAYLVTYNVLSALGWAYVFAFLVIHLFNLDGNSDNVYEPHKNTATFVLSRFLWSLSLRKTFRTQTLESHLPSLIQPIYRRATTAYTRVGVPTAFVQSFAFLEVVHVIFGWVRSPLQTTVMQVSSRLFLVWGIAEQFPEVLRSSITARKKLLIKIIEGPLESPLRQYGLGVVGD